MTYERKFTTALIRHQLGLGTGLTLAAFGSRFVSYHVSLMGHRKNGKGQIVAYLPPVQQAPSDHNYDGRNPNKVDDKLGGINQLLQLHVMLGKASAGCILDIVPNHLDVPWDNLQAWKEGRSCGGSGNVFWDNNLLRERVFDLDPKEHIARRFFDVDTLVGVRVEDPEVMDLTHELLYMLVQSGILQGVRVDHPDGLRLPIAYIRRLAQELARRAGKPVPIWVEKILTGSEKLGWNVAGDVGYQSLNMFLKMWVPPQQLPLFRKTYKKAAKDRRSFARILAASRLEIAETTQAPEVRQLASILNNASLEPYIAQSLTALDVYRTYMDPDTNFRSARDVRLIRRAVKKERLHSGIARVLLGEAVVTEEQQDEAAYRKFTALWQHLTGPNMAMGAENTAFFRYPLALGVCEVGGDPAKLGVSFAEAHALNRNNQKHQPETGLALSTHDSKFGWLTRARMLAMLEVGDEFCSTLWPRWLARYGHLLNDGHDDGRVGRNLWFLLQVLIGAGLGVDEISKERFEQIQAAINKMLCEAKMETHWCRRDKDWEKLVADCAAAMFAGEEARDGKEAIQPLTADPLFMQFVTRVDQIAQRNGLRQRLLTMASPGVPIFYQGDELRVATFVDPDNRRAQPWEQLEKMLARTLSGSKDLEIERMVMIHRVMSFRNENPELFGPESVYEALPASDGVFAFRRSCNGKSLRVSAGGKLEGGTDLLRDFDDVSFIVE
jgi:(1->4)-alpha-D-glucan 1-alpha-D-glucosylmutase